MTSQEKYNLLDKLHLCHRCEKARPAPERKYCFDCLEKIKEYNQKVYNLERARAYQERRREIYKQKIENGRCVRCSRMATHGIYCYECYIKVKRHNKKTAERRKRERHDRGLIPELRKEQGLCLRCGEPASGGKYCKVCMKKIISDLNEAREKSPFRSMERCRVEELRKGESVE